MDTFFPCPKPEKKIKVKEYKPSLIWERFRAYEIYGCEVQLEGCTGSLFQTIAHKMRRRHYLNKGNLINKHKETICACTNCHDKIDANKKLLKQTFNRLRGV